MSVGCPTVRTCCGDSRDAEMLLSETCPDKPQLRFFDASLVPEACLDRFVDSKEQSIFSSPARLDYVSSPLTSTVAVPLS
jgi:hypothetical protein